jgi:hypothetical protein
VPYNLFKLFLVHKISIREYIYENRKKKWKKEKEKEFQANWVGGDFGPASARPRGQAAHSARQRRNGAGMAPWARAHVPEGGEADGVRRGVNRSGSTAGEVRGGSPPGSRFCDGGVVARHGRG